MASSHYLARLIGPVALVIGLGLFVNRDSYVALAREFLRSAALIYLSGLLAMTAGVAIILGHNVWVAGWPVVITLLGWIAAVGGVVRMTVPQLTRRIGEDLLDRPATLTVSGAVWLALGLLLCFFGYIR